MSLFKNNIMSLVTDPSFLGPEINNSDYVSVACVSGSDSYMNHPNVHDCSILLPPTDMMMAWVDGKIILQNEYPKYLLSKDPDDMIVALLSALTKKNIILYIPEDDNGIFATTLFNHLRFTYGITMRTPTTYFAFDYNKLPLLLSKFYMIEVMDPMDYLKSYPQQLLLPEWVIPKLAQELHPFNHQASFQEYANYFNGIVQQGRQPQVMAVRQ